MLKGKNKNLICLVAAIVCVVNGVTLCQAMKKPSLNEKFQVNEGTEDVDKKSVEIDGILIPQSAKLINYENLLTNFKNKAYYNNNNCQIYSYYKNFKEILHFCHSNKSNHLKNNDQESNSLCKECCEEQIFISKYDVEVVGKSLLSKWLKNIVQHYDDKLFDKLAQRVVAFFDVTNVLHYFVCFSDNKTLAFLGSSSDGVCGDDESCAAGYKEQNDISFVNELDEKSFKENCWLGSIIRCCNGDVMPNLKILDSINNMETNLNEKKFNENVEKKKNIAKIDTNINGIKVFDGDKVIDFELFLNENFSQNSGLQIDVLDKGFKFFDSKNKYYSKNKKETVSNKSKKIFKQLPFYISKDAIKEVSLRLVGKWLKKNHVFEKEKLYKFKNRVVAFFDVTKVVHYFLCLNGKKLLGLKGKKLLFLGSSSYGVCDDKNDLVSFKFDKEPKSINFVNELDEKSFKENCCLEQFIWCFGIIMDRRKLNDVNKIFMRLENVNQTINSNYLKNNVKNTQSNDNKKDELNVEIEKKPNEINNFIKIPEGAKLMNYDEGLKSSENRTKVQDGEYKDNDSGRFFYVSVLSNLGGLKFEWDKTNLFEYYKKQKPVEENNNEQTKDIRNIGFVVRHKRNADPRNKGNKGCFYVSKADVKKVSAHILKNWLTKNKVLEEKEIKQLQEKNVDKLKQIANKVVAFFDVKKVVHYFLCLNDEQLLFLGSSSYGVCDDENDLVSFIYDKEQKSINFVDKFDEKSFKENCWLEMCIRCENGCIIGGLHHIFE